MKTLARRAAFVLSAIILLTAPASATGVECTIPPGTYIITNSSGQLIGALIVYPDCHLEILPVEKDQMLV